MTAQVQEILHSIEGLAASDKQQLVATLLRSYSDSDSEPMPDEAFTEAAAEIFLQLDRDEALHG